MYCRYWELTESPFQPHGDTRYFFESPTHEEALARLDFLVENRRRMGLLVGGAGSGKSLVLEVFAQRLRRLRQRVAHFSLLGLEPSGFLPQAVDLLGISVEGETSGALWRAVSETLSVSRYEQRATVFLLDDADAAGEGILTQLVRLVELDRHRESRLTVVLACRTQRARKLGERLLDLCELRIEIEHWSAAETAQFVQTSLRTAGRQSPIFTPQALAELHRLCQGSPRRIVHLADLALLAGAGSGLREIDAQTIASACHELTVEHVGG